LSSVHLPPGENMESVNLRDLPRQDLLEINDNLDRMLRNQPKHQAAVSPDEVKIAYEPNLRTYILYRVRKPKPAVRDDPTRYEESRRDYGTERGEYV